MLCPARMADFLRNMDPAHRAFLAIFIAVMLKSALFVQWERYKARQESRPTTMRLKNGVYVPWGPVQRIQRFFQIALYIWLFWMAVMLALLAYTKIMGYSNLF